MTTLPLTQLPPETTEKLVSSPPLSDPPTGWDQAVNYPVPYLGTSDLSAAARCPRKFFYSRICSLEKPGPKTAMDFGSAIHRAMPAILQDGDLKKALEMFQLVWQDREGDDKGRTSGNAAVILSQLLEQHGPQNPNRQYDLLSPPTGTLRVADKYSDWEIPFTFLLPGTRIPIHSRIDGWAKDRITGEVWALEYKTTQTLSPWFLDNFDMNLQVFLYALVLRQFFGQPVAGTILHAIETNKPTKSTGKMPTSYPKRIPISDYKLNSFVKQLTWLVLSIEHMLETRSFPQRFWACSGYGMFGSATFPCDFSQACQTEDWTRMRELYEIRDYQPFVLEGEKVPEKPKKVELVQAGSILKWV